jgi:phosphoglycerate dehydrogenase-like enzyme
MDNIDLAAAKERGIAVLRAAGANAQGVAELTIGLLFSLLRGIPQSDAALKRGEWRRQKGVEAAGLTLGVIGCGNIGQLVTRMALTIGMAVRAYDPYPDTNFAPGADPDVADFAFAAYEEVITSADVLTLHCPPAPDGTPLIDGDILSRARDGVYLINTARAELLDTEAVRAALDDGRLARVALDTVERVEPGHPLATHERVIGTPHIGGYTRQSGARAARAAVTNLLAHLSGHLQS